ncbi:MAG: hypothetical protein ACRYG2_06910 [Janthinobacterium lividum]
MVGHVWLSERNADGSAPPTREGLPLTDAAGRAIVLGPTWDALVTG